MPFLSMAKGCAWPLGALSQERAQSSQIQDQTSKLTHLYPQDFARSTSENSRAAHLHESCKSPTVQKSRGRKGKYKEQSLAGAESCRQIHADSTLLGGDSPAASLATYSGLCCPVSFSPVHRAWCLHTRNAPLWDPQGLMNGVLFETCHRKSYCDIWAEQAFALFSGLPTS